MDDSQEEWYGTFLKLKQFLTTNAADLTVLIAGEKTKLDNLLNAIDLQDAIANSDDTGFTVMKENVIVTLQLQAKKISRGLTSYFEEKGDAGNLEKAKMTNTEIEYRDDAKLNMRANSLYLIGNAPAVKTDPVLANSQLMPADIDELETKRIAFLNIVSLPDEKRGDRSAANKEKARLFEMGNKEILPRLENLMSPYESNNEILFDKYESARAIDNLGGSSGSEGYELANYTIPGGGWLVIANAPAPGENPDVYIRNLSPTNAIICTTDGTTGPCASGYTIAGKTLYKAPYSGLGLTPGLPKIQISNPGSDAVLVRAGTKKP